VPPGIGILDLQGHTTSANEVLRQALGYTHEELAGWTLSAFIHPDDRQAYLNRFTQLGRRPSRSVRRG
jgi:PAS domain S-box-containing protein